MLAVIAVNPDDTVDEAPDPRRHFCRRGKG
jgi:hypothetical protein